MKSNEVFCFTSYALDVCIMLHIVHKMSNVYVYVGVMCGAGGRGGGERERERERERCLDVTNNSNKL